MALSSTLKSAINRAFAALDDVAGEVQFTKSQESYDATTGVLTLTQQVFSTTGVLDSYREEEIDGSMIQVNDSRLFCKPTEGYEPEVGDSVSVGLSSFTVHGVRPVYAYDSVVLLEVHVRR